MQIRTPGGGYEYRSASALLPWGSTAPSPPGAAGYAVAGVNITEQTALQIAAVYGSVALIAESIATLPIKQYRQASSPVEMALAPVIDQPWPEFSQHDFVMQAMVSMLLRGNVFGKIVARDARMFPAQVQLVHPEHVKLRRNRENGQIEVRYWNQIVPPDDVTRAMAFSVPEAIAGLSPVENFRTTFGRARAQDMWAAAFYSNSARPDLVIEVPGPLDPVEAKAMKDDWDGAFQGIGNSHRPAVVTGGATVKPITMSMADAQFLQQSQMSWDEISGLIYRVPGHMLSMTDKSTSWGAGIEQQELGFVRNTLLIWLRRLEAMLSSWLPPGQYVRFDLKERLRGDTLQRFSAYQIARVAGFMSNLDIMRAESMELPTDSVLIDQLSDYTAPLNSAPVKPASSSVVGPGGDKSD